MRNITSLLFIACIAMSINVQSQDNSVRVVCPLVNGKLLPAKCSPIESTKFKNNGLDIQMDSDQNVYSNVNGSVSKIIRVAENNLAILVRSGEMVYLFANLSKTAVQENDKIRLDQNIGSLNESGALHFEVWQGKNCIPAEQIELLCKK